MGLLSFLTGRKASMDDRSAYGSFWFNPLGFGNSAGMRVSPDTAMRIGAVYASVRVLSETMASLPFCLTRPRADGGKDRVTDHWAYRLFNRRPNEFQTPFEFREMLQGHLALRGNAYSQIFTNQKGEITDLLPISPDAITVEILENGDYRYRVRLRNGDTTVLSRSEVWHLRGLSSDGILGLSPIAMARESFGAALAAQDYSNRFFSNDAKPTGGWLEMPGVFKDAEARKVFQESLQNAQSGSNRHKLMVLDNGMKYHEVGINNRDSQFLELRQYQVTDIARIFRIPPHLIGDLSRATFTNIEQQSLEFATYTMTPWAERWESSIESQLLLDSDNLEVEFDFDNLLRGDQAARAAFYSSGINAGWLTRNEARVAENLNPIEGLDEPLVPLNMVEDDGETEASETSELPPQDTASARYQARLNAILQSSVDRLARREIGMIAGFVKSSTPHDQVKEQYLAFGQIVSDALGVDASLYVADRCLQFCALQSGEIELFTRSAATELARLAELEK